MLTLVTLIVKFPEGVDGGDERNPEETPTDPPTFSTSKMMPEPRLRRTKELASKETSLASFTDTRSTLESTKEGIEDCNLWLNGYKKILMKKNLSRPTKYRRLFFLSTFEKTQRRKNSNKTRPKKKTQ